jgi:hypothetical protein
MWKRVVVVVGGGGHMIAIKSEQKGRENVIVFIN